ncbi:Translation factor GUF1-like, mitochondrial, partial [Vitis vinifera]
MCILHARPIKDWVGGVLMKGGKDIRMAWRLFGEKVQKSLDASPVMFCVGVGYSSMYGFVDWYFLVLIPFILCALLYNIKGFKPAKHMVFSGLYPADGSDFEALNHA